MKFKEILENEGTIESYTKRIDLEEMKLLQKNISTPASPESWESIKQIYYEEE